MLRHSLVIDLVIRQLEPANANIRHLQRDVRGLGPRPRLRDGRRPRLHRPGNRAVHARPAHHRCRRRPPPELRQQAEDAGLAIIGLHWLLAKTEGFHAHVARRRRARRRTADYLGELARCCRDLGGDLMVFGSPMQRRIPAGHDPRAGDRLRRRHLPPALPARSPTRREARAWSRSRRRRPTSSTTAAEAVELLGPARPPELRAAPGREGDVARRRSRRRS